MPGYISNLEDLLCCQVKVSLLCRNITGSFPPHWQWKWCLKKICKWASFTVRANLPPPCPQEWSHTALGNVMTLLNERLKYEMHNSSLIPDLVPAPIPEHCLYFRSAELGFWFQSSVIFQCQTKQFGIIFVLKSPLLLLSHKVSLYGSSG